MQISLLKVNDIVEGKMGCHFKMFHQFEVEN